MIVLPVRRRRPRPVRIVLPAVDLDIDVRRYLSIESPGARMPGLWLPRNTDVAEPQAHECFPVRFIRTAHESPPAARRDGRSREDGIHAGIPPLQVVHHGRTARDRDIPAFGGEDEDERVLHGHAPRRRRYRVPRWTGPVDADRVIRIKSRAAIGRSPQPARTAWDHQVDPVSARHPESVRLESGDAGETSSYSDGAHRGLGRARNRVPPVPHAEDRAPLERSAQVGVTIAEREQVTPALEEPSRSDDSLDRKHAPTVSSPGSAATADNAIGGELRTGVTVEDARCRKRRRSRRWAQRGAFRGHPSVDVLRFRSTPAARNAAQAARVVRKSVPDPVNSSADSSCVT